MLFLCENNLYAMGTALARSESQTSITAKAESYRVPAESVDGMDVLAVEQAARRSAESVRGGDGPRLLEFQTYRYRAHSMSDPDLYREKAEIEEWKQRDPIALFEARLRGEGLLDDEEARAIEQRVENLIEHAVQEAESGEPEAVEDLQRFLMAAES